MKKHCSGLFTGVLACLFAVTLTARAGIFTDLHDFDDTTTNGALPIGLIVNDGVIYGATTQGGAFDLGMVFTMGTNGANFSSVHDFNDGSSPNELLLAGGTLYGTTHFGGNAYGLIYSVNTSGSGYKVIYNFTNSPDAQFPWGGLTLGGATLYGTTSAGGTNNAGTIFKIDTNGQNYAVLYSLTNTPDGANPQGRLLLNGATLYGTTYAGGSNSLGTVFKISTNGTGYSVIYNFSNAPAATAPEVGLAFAGNTLYGITTGGGTASAGALFQLATNGTGFAITHSLTNTDGLSPQGPLTVNNNLLYGTALSGGTGGGGTIFQVATNGANFTVLKNFTNVLTGVNPKGTLALDGNAIYGIANYNGPGGRGVAFRLVPAPVITAQPQGLTATNGNPASFTVAVSDEFPLAYQWYFNTNTFLAGQTGSTLNLTGVGNGNAGYYTVVITDNAGSVTSSPALLTVIGSPVITAQPQSLTVTNGNPATFTVSATTPAGTTLTYQWYFNTNTVIAGQTNNSYAIPLVLSNNAGAYTVIVANSFGSVTSTPAILTFSIKSKPIITAQPGNLTLTNGDTANFNVTASGQPTLYYQWYTNGVPTSIGSVFTGKTNALLSTSVNTNKHYYFTVVVTNNLGKATSNPALLTIVTVPLILTNPQPASVPLGDPATFAVTAFGAALHYQWYSNSVNTAIGTLLAKQTNSTYSFNTITGSNGKYYSVVVTNTYGRATSSPPALLTVTTLPYITLQPLPGLVTNGSSLTFTSGAAGPGPLSYQWLFQTNLLVAGATNTTLTVTVTNQAGYYSMMVTNIYGSATSSLALLTVLSPPYITLQPLGATITNGGSITFISAAAGLGTLGYQWLFQTNQLIPGATGTSLTLAMANQPGTYSMMVTNLYGAATSSPALLTVIGRPLMLSSVFDPASGSYGFTFENLAGSTNRLWATTNLANPAAWQVIATNHMTTNGLWLITDTNSAQTNAMRFYQFSSP
jgi:uncharacterized repeat protein (TIGR03803 family)